MDMRPEPENIISHPAHPSASTSFRPTGYAIGGGRYLDDARWSFARVSQINPSFTL
jgi:hypothetical protein